MTINGTSGNDMLSGTSGNDIFNVAQGGSDNVDGGAGNDQFHFGASFGAGDIVSGGVGNDILDLGGDYSGANHLTFAASALTSVEQVRLAAGHSYDLTTVDVNVAAGQTLTVNASALGLNDVLTFNGAAESNANFKITGGAGGDTIRGGGIVNLVHAGDGNDTIYGFSSGQQSLYGEGGNDFISLQSAGKVFGYGGDGNDTFGAGSFLTSADRYDGGAGNDEVDLGSGYAAGFIFKATTISNVETLFLDLNDSFRLTMNNGNVAAGQHMDIDGDLLQNGNTLIINAAQETDGSLFIGGGMGNDIIVGGQAGNTISGGGSHDKLAGGTGADTYLYYGPATDSSGATHDAIYNFDAAHDGFNFITTVTGVDAAIAAGTMNANQFDANLTAAVDAAHLAAGHAVLFTASAGNLSGHTFLVVDDNGVAGYQSGADFVMELIGATNLGALVTGSFT